jgi:hypothetical protein
MVKNNISWIGRPHNVFHNSKSTMPVNMFKDNDRDGVANVFDCKPNNPKEEGLISALVGAVGGVFKKGKGTVAAGWREGMAKNKFSRVQSSSVPLTNKQQKDKRFNDIMAERVRVQDEAAKARIILARKKSFPYRASRYIYKAVPGLSEAVSKDYGRAIVNARNRVLRDKLTLTEKKRSMVIKKGFASVIPVIRASDTQATYGVQSRAGEMGRTRGRPKGTLDPRYAAYGGVFAYRKAMSARRRGLRQELQQQQEMIRRARIINRGRPQQVQMPQYETQEYQGQEQVSQEQMQQYPQQMQQMQPQQVQQYPQYPQVQQQIAVEAERKPIATVFKSSGGSPYPPVDRRPLTPTANTVPQGYVESVDAFTGRRFFKKLPQAENWIR